VFSKHPQPWGTAMVVCGIAAQRENSSHGGALGEKCEC